MEKIIVEARNEVPVLGEMKLVPDRSYKLSGLVAEYDTQENTTDAPVAENKIRMPLPEWKGPDENPIAKLAAEGVAELHLVNRTVAKAEKLASEITGRFLQTKASVGYPENAANKIDLVLNATSLGLKPADALPLDESQFSLANAPAVFDMIYQPALTPLLARATDASCRTANGLGMLLWQGAKAQEIWTGQPAPIDVMRAALESHIYGDE